jgi:hypothetical protein
MDSDLIKAQHYRDQSDKMRELAAMEENEEVKAALYALADMFDRLFRQCTVNCGQND